MFEQVDSNGKALTINQPTNLRVQLGRKEFNHLNECIELNLNGDRYQEGIAINNCVFTRAINHLFHPAAASTHQLFTNIYGNDRPGTIPETYETGITELKKLFRTYEQQYYYFYQAKTVKLSQNENVEFTLKRGAMKDAIFIIYCKGDGSRLFVEASQGPGGRFIKITGEFPMFAVVYHKFNGFSQNVLFKLWNQSGSNDMTRPALVGGEPTVEVTIFQFQKGLFSSSSREFDFNRLR